MENTRKHYFVFLCVHLELVQHALQSIFWKAKDLILMVLHVFGTGARSQKLEI